MTSLQIRYAVLGLFITLALSGCQGSRFLAADTFGATGMQSGAAAGQEIPAIAGQQESSSPVRLQQAVPSDLVYGAVISENPAEAGRFLDAIPHKDAYHLVAVLAPTSYADPSAKIFTYDSAGALAPSGIVLDNEVLQNLACCRVVKSLGAIGKASSWNDGMMEVLKQKFPDAGFILLSFGGTLTAGEVQDAANLLKNSLPRESLVLVKAGFATSADSNIQAYRNEFVNDVLFGLDLAHFTSLPLPDPSAIEVFGEYLKLAGAEKESVVSRTGGRFQMAFVKGDPAVRSRVFLVAFGDVMLGRFVRSLMDRNGLDYPFTLLDRDYLRVNDILLANLEGPVAEKAVKTTKAIAFRFMPDIVPLLKKYGFDVLGLANNHALDMGEAGYTDSIRLLKDVGITPFGDPRGINDGSVAAMDVDGQKIAFFGLEEVTFKINDDLAVQKIKDLTAEGYQVIPFVHWGVEYTHKPTQRQKDLAHKFIDAGAAAVIGHHPHVVQAFEDYKGRPVFYSLGNAIFDQYWSADTQVGLSIAMIIGNGNMEILFTPLKILQSRPELMTGDERDKFLEEYVSYNGDLADNEKNAIMQGRLTLYNNNL